MSETTEADGPMIAVPFKVWAKLMRESSADTFREAQRAASPIFSGLVWTERDVKELLRAHSPEMLADHQLDALATTVAVEWREGARLAEPLTASLSVCTEAVMRVYFAPPALKFEVGGVVRERDADGAITKFDLREVSIVLSPAPLRKGDAVETK